MDRIARALQHFVDLQSEGSAPEVEPYVLDQPVDIQPGLREALMEYLAEDQKQDVEHAELEAGFVLDGFELIRRLGGGGMASVWEADQLTIERSVALKILAPRHSYSTAEITRFWREARACGRIQHPNVTTVYSIGEEHGLHYIAMELVGGGRTLADRIDELRHKSESRWDAAAYDAWIVRAFAALARGLNAVHMQGVVHRDVKPSNILLAFDDVKLADFGFALVRDDERVPIAGLPVGTAAYMSPEQAATSEGLDHRSDIFSLGVTMYEALTLIRPFDGESSDSLFEQIRSLNPPVPKDLRPGCPTRLSEICCKALAKDPEQRFRSGEEMALALERAPGPPGGE